jgi:hypothetical protein
MLNEQQVALPVSMIRNTAKNLALLGVFGQNNHIRKTARIGFGDPESHWRTAASVRFFHVRMPWFPYGRALVGIPSGMPGSYVSGSPTPPCACPPRLATEGG